MPKKAAAFYRMDSCDTFTALWAVHEELPDETTFIGYDPIDSDSIDTDAEEIYIFGSIPMSEALETRIREEPDVTCLIFLPKTMYDGIKPSLVEDDMEEHITYVAQYSTIAYNAYEHFFGDHMPPKVVRYQGAVRETDKLFCLALSEQSFTFETWDEIEQNESRRFELIKRGRQISADMKAKVAQARR